MSAADYLGKVQIDASRIQRPADFALEPSDIVGIYTLQIGLWIADANTAGAALRTFVNCPQIPEELGPDAEGHGRDQDQDSQPCPDRSFQSILLWHSLAHVYDLLQPRPGRSPSCLFPDRLPPTRQAQLLPLLADGLHHLGVHGDLLAPFAVGFGRPLVGGVQADLGAQARLR